MCVEIVLLFFAIYYYYYSLFLISNFFLSFGHIYLDTVSDRSASLSGSINPISSKMPDSFRLATHRIIALFSWSDTGLNVGNGQTFHDKSESGVNFFEDSAC